MQTSQVLRNRQGICTLEVRDHLAAAAEELHLTSSLQLTDVDDLEGGGTMLDTGQVCRLPLIPLEGLSLAHTL